MAQLIAIIGMVIALLASFGLGRWLDIAQKQAAASFEFAPFFWGALLTNLLIALIWFVLTWWVVFKVKGSRLVAASYILAWLLTMLLPVVQWTAPEAIGSLSLMEITSPLRFNLSLTGLNALVRSYILILGIYILVSPRLRRFEDNSAHAIAVDEQS